MFGHEEAQRDYLFCSGEIGKKLKGFIPLNSMPAALSVSPHDRSWRKIIILQIGLFRT